MKKFKKLSKAQQRDFDCYKQVMEGIKIGMPQQITTAEYATLLEHWYFLWDTHGIRANFENIDECWKLVQAKWSLNLTISLWIEDHLCDKPVTFAAEIRDWCKTLPSWVWQSYINQFKKVSKNVYVPSFADPTKLIPG